MNKVKIIFFLIALISAGNAVYIIMRGDLAANITVVPFSLIVSAVIFISLWKIRQRRLRKERQKRQPRKNNRPKSGHLVFWNIAEHRNFMKRYEPGADGKSVFADGDLEKLRNPGKHIYGRLSINKLQTPDMGRLVEKYCILFKTNYMIECNGRVSINVRKENGELLKFIKENDVVIESNHPDFIEKPIHKIFFEHRFSTHVIYTDSWFTSRNSFI